MKVSVIVAAYNIEDYIERCLDSLVKQTLKDIEIIVVNDGSTDKTNLKIKTISDIDSRVKLINQENKGSIEARKYGLNIAKGEYILFVDGDDWLEFNALETLYENAKENNSDIVLYQAFSAYDSKKELFKLNTKCEKYTLKEVFTGSISPTIWSKFIKLDYINSNNIQFPSNISFAEDLATCCSLFMFNPRVSIVDTSLYNYYQRLNSITNQINPKVLEIDDAFIFIKKMLNDNGLYLKYKDIYEFCVYKHMFSFWFIKYVYIEDKYNIELYQKYKSYNIDINSNPYIRENLSKYPLSFKIRIQAYHRSYKLGKLCDYIRRVCKRGQ